MINQLKKKKKLIISLLLVVSSLAGSLPALLASTSVDAAERKENLNAVKMSIYLLCKLTEILESNSYRRTIITAPGKVGCKIKMVPLVWLTSVLSHWWAQVQFFGQSPLRVLHRAVKKANLEERDRCSGTLKERRCCKPSSSSSSWIFAPSGICPWWKKSSSGNCCERKSKLPH